jgi:hypothetical protein
LKKTSWSFLVIFLLSTLVACGGGVADSSAATVTALAQALANATPTSAAATVDATPIVATQSPDEAVEGARLTATAIAVAQEGTRAAGATTEAESAAATATVLAPIQAELSTYDVDANDYRLAHIYQPVTLEVEGYRQYTYDENFLQLPVRDFVLAADITWNTRFGFAGCGFVVRSNGVEDALNQYMIFASRYGDGRVLFTVLREGDVNLEEVTNVYAPANDPSFDWRNDQTNRLAVVGRGDTFAIYGNGSKLVDVQATAGFLEGFVTFVALNESGRTHCEFSNAWLWLLN